MKGGTQRNSKRSGFLGKAFITMAALMGIGGGAVMSNSTSNQQNNTRNVSKDSINSVEKYTPRTVQRSKIHGSGDANPYKHHRKGQLNQVEARKKLRSNPSLRKSKKSPIRKKR